MAGYDFSLSSKAVHALFGVSPSCRRKAMGLIEHLAANPFLPADLQESSQEGRTYHVLVRGDIVLTYWVDHGARILRVMLVEWVKE